MVQKHMQYGNAAPWALAAVIAVILVGLFALVQFSVGVRRTNGRAPCLAPGLPLVQHIHPQLRILVDGKEERIPANIGIGGCERALHTHDGTGEIHVEAQDSHEYTLGEFFATWGMALEREGYVPEMTVDDAPSAELGALKFKDKQRIVVQYKKVGK